MRTCLLAMAVLGLPLMGADAPATPPALPATPAWAATVGDDAHGRWADLDVGGVTQRLRWIPAGTFTMGSPQAEKDATVKDDLDPAFIANEVPHAVTLTTGFWLADSACTQGLWQYLMGSNPSGFLGDAHCPVESVSWRDVQEFLARLNARVPGGAFALPTEAQREYACRAGSHGEFAGPSLDALGWFSDNSQEQTHAVKLKEPNAWGLYDMHGNIWELCSDWYADYPAGPAVNPTGPATGTERVRRGGCWNIESSFCRSAYRCGSDPNAQTIYLGFRFSAPAASP